MVAASSSASGWVTGWAPWGWRRSSSAVRASSSAAVTSMRARDRAAGGLPAAHRLEEVVLELLVDDVHDEDGDAGAGRLQEGDGDGGDRTDGGADEGQQIGEAHPQAEDTGEGDADDGEEDPRHQPGDDRDQQVA